VPQVDAGIIVDFVTMYYGNPTCVNGWDPENVWNSDFVAVYHMNDATASTILDSTANGNDGTKKDANEPIQIAGAVGYGQDFDGAGDYIAIPHSAAWNFGVNDFTLEYWQYLDNTPAWQNTSISHGSYYSGWNIWPNGAAMTFYSANDTQSWPGVIVEDAWQHFAFTGDGSDMVLYTDGASSGSKVYKANWVQDRAAKPLLIGIDSDLVRDLEFVADEIRISNVQRSADWIEASYLSATDAFISYGAQLGIPVVVTDAPADLGYQFQVGHGLRLNGTLSSVGSEASVQVYFQYGTTPGLGASTTPFTMSAPGTFIGQLRGLDHGTYYCRAVAQGTLATVYGATEVITLGGSGIINILPFMLIVCVVAAWGSAIYTRNTGLFFAAILGTVIVLAMLPFVINVLK